VFPGVPVLNFCHSEGTVLSLAYEVTVQYVSVLLRVWLFYSGGTFLLVVIPTTKGCKSRVLQTCEGDYALLYL